MVQNLSALIGALGAFVSAIVGAVILYRRSGVQERRSLNTHREQLARHRDYEQTVGLWGQGGPVDHVPRVPISLQNDTDAALDDPGEGPL